MLKSVIDEKPIRSGVGNNDLESIFGIRRNKMANKLESIFDNLSDVEFEDILKRCNLSFEKVEKGQGGLFINGEKVEANELPSFIPRSYNNNE